MPEAAILADGRPATVGICEDDHTLRDVLRRTLSSEGYRIRATASGTEALSAFTAESPDLLVLDITLQDADGRDVCSALRARGITTPVLFLTARHDLADRLAAFRVGGDDYLTKPFELAELLVRLRALLRRSPPGEAAAGLRLDSAAHALIHGPDSVALTRTEFRLLAALMDAQPEVVHRASLVAAGWPDGGEPRANTLDSSMARVRTKLRQVEAPLTLSTIRGVGYALR